MVALDLGSIDKVVGFLLSFFFGVFRFGFYWSIWVYLLWVGWEIYLCYCVLCVCDHVLMFKFEFVFFVFGSGFVLYVLVLMFKYVIMFLFKMNQI